MKPEEQIEALAKLDGFKFALINFFRDRVFHGSGTTFGQVRVFSENGTNDFPKYLEYYDVIIPLIQKQSDEIKVRLAGISKQIMNHSPDEDYLHGYMRLMLELTPAQLSEALLRAHNLWKDLDIK